MREWSREFSCDGKVCGGLCEPVCCALSAPVWVDAEIANFDSTLRIAARIAVVIDAAADCDGDFRCVEFNEKDGVRIKPFCKELFGSWGFDVGKVYRVFEDALQELEHLFSEGSIVADNFCGECRDSWCGRCV